MAPRIERLSQHQINDGDTSSIFIYGEGFSGATGVAFGEEWSPDWRVDGDTVITVKPPDMPAGSSCWVVVYTESDGESPCEGDAQWFSVVALESAPVAGELRLDSITPKEITIGRNDSYWIMGSGLAGVTGVILASSACQFECYDDERLVFWTPEELNGVTPDSENELSLYGHGNSKEFRVMCRAVPAPDGGNTAPFPSVAVVEPTHLGPEGGFVTFTGDSLLGVVRAFLGDVELLNIDVTSSTQLTATVPLLDDYVGQELAPMVINGDSASPDSSARLTVTGG